MTEPIYKIKDQPATVTCAHCGATIDRAASSPIVAQAQVGEVVDMSRRHQCADRERCEERGPIAQTVEQLRADLEAAQTVIESQRRRIKRAEETEQALRHELGVAQLQLKDHATLVGLTDLAKATLKHDVDEVTGKVDDLCELAEELKAERDEIDARFRLARHEIGELRHELGRLKSQEQGNAWPLVYTGGEHDPDATATVLVRALEGRLERLEVELSAAQQDVARLSADFEDAEQQRAKLQVKLDRIDRERLRAEDDAGRLRSRLFSIKQATLAAALEPEERLADIKQTLSEVGL